MSASCDISTIDNVIKIITNYGLLYNWYAVSDAQGLAPTGWHIPTKDEVDTLNTFLGGVTVAGGKLKAEGVVYWNYPNIGATNTSGFTGYGSGYRTFGGEFSSLGNLGYFSTSTESSINNAYGCELSRTEISDRIVNANKKVGNSVRCIRDNDTGWVTGETVTDYDNNVYNTVQIGTQIWMVTNLKVTHFRNGTVIPESTSAENWASATTPLLCAYDDNWNNI